LLGAINQQKGCKSIFQLHKGTPPDSCANLNLPDGEELYKLNSNVQ